eukprot:gnl/TRDRNA2_/TRDRNA2_192503_c0_seq1.p1 gnl/TRDRNA2_/TRDRNA2_192503_c0~~gnl/TRDRNA2_/TRDRNA2_192503_c0_seq1.p1  ORF type:complete len:165 (+),score=16.62 gnl/TRDRNA2_/TRDRNA2_192503_c0_seq1:89-583(+)
MGGTLDHEEAFWAASSGVQLPKARGVTASHCNGSYGTMGLQEAFVTSWRPRNRVSAVQASAFLMGRLDTSESHQIAEDMGAEATCHPRCRPPPGWVCKPCMKEPPGPPPLTPDGELAPREPAKVEATTKYSVPCEGATRRSVLTCAKGCGPRPAAGTESLVAQC